MSGTIEIEVKRERAGVVIPWFDTRLRPDEERFAETTGLIEALGCELSFVRADRIRKISPSHLLSGGVLDALKADLHDHDCSIFVVDAALSPIQQRNLERKLGIKVIDRTGLILEIFGLRANTKEGELQVELARLMYERSRLVRTWTHLERQRGGRGFLGGPGETQLESDKRMIDRALKKLRQELEAVRRTRGLHREGRQKSGTPTVALIGYTNTGKSTLFNRLTGADVLAQDMPFATLDPTTRHIQLESLGEAALIDTVGFITDLPTHLVESFRATLEEVVEADLLIHVSDRSSANQKVQREDVLKILGQLEKQTKTKLPPMIEAWNKVDVLTEDLQQGPDIQQEEEDSDTVLISALTGYGVSNLLTKIEEKLRGASSIKCFKLLPKQGRARSWLHQNNRVISEVMQNDGSALITVSIDDAAVGRFRSLFENIHECS